MRLTRRELLAGIAAIAPMAAYGQVERPPARAGRITPPLSLEQILSNSGLGRNAGFSVVDLRTGRELEAHNPRLARPPASVTKIMTALYGEARLGADYRFETRVIAAGAVRDGVLQGDMYLVGGGDPQLDTDDLNVLASQIKAAGISRITGRLFVVSSALPWIDRIAQNQPMQAGYNASVSGLNLNYNRVYFEWKRETSGYRVSMDARSERVRPQVSVAQIRVAQRRSPTYEYQREGGVERWSVASAALGRGGGRWLPVRDSARYAAEVFQVLAAGQGVELPIATSASAVPQGRVVAQVFSNDLRTMLREMLRYSNNLTAETIGLTATKTAGAGADTLRASAQEMARWVTSQSRQTRPKLYNHSGLSEQSRITARELVQFLAKPSSQNGLAGILRESPLQNGRGDAVELPGLRVLAKSGTLNFTRGLAGYIEQDGEPRFAFAIFSADMAARRAASPNEERPAGARRWRDIAKAQEKALLYRWASVLA